MKASFFLNSPFSSKKCPGLNSSGVSHWSGSKCEEVNNGMIVMPFREKRRMKLLVSTWVIPKKYLVFEKDLGTPKIGLPKW